MYVRSSQAHYLGAGMGRYGLGDTSRVQSEVTAAAQRYGVDPQLALLIAQHESAYNQTNSAGGTLTSSAGALGVMQLMPATAAGLGVNPNDELQNIDGGVRLLSQLLKQFNGNVTNAVAAYSAGPGAVQKYGGVPPYPETQNYVAFINANYSGPGSAGSPSSLVPPDSSSDPSSSYPDTLLTSWYSSFLPDPSASYDIAGYTISGSELVAVGLGVVGVVVVLSLL